MCREERFKEDPDKPFEQDKEPCCRCGKTGKGPVVIVHNYSEKREIVLVYMLEYCGNLPRENGKYGHVFHKLCNSCSDNMRIKRSDD